MDLKPLAANMTELTVNENLVILFSYKTPVAIMTQDGYVKTKKFWSRTTSHHITKWLPCEAKVELKPQEFFDSLLNEVK